MTAAQNPLTPALVHYSGTSRDLPTPQRALAIGAHPDDTDFFCGGTLAKWAAAGSEITVLVCTDGSKGTWDPSIDKAELVATRRLEQREAARRLGIQRVEFLDWPDGELDSGLRQRWQVAYWIRATKANIVLGHDPWKPYRLHPDHRHAGLLTCEGVVAARDHLFFTEQNLPHHRPDAILLFETDNADHAEDVTGFADVKFEALAAHVSQHESTMHAADGGFKDQVLAKLAAAGDVVGTPHAEVFKLIDDL